MTKHMQSLCLHRIKDLQPCQSYKLSLSWLFLISTFLLLWKIVYGLVFIFLTIIRIFALTSQCQVYKFLASSLALLLGIYDSSVSLLFFLACRCEKGLETGVRCFWFLVSPMFISFEILSIKHGFLISHELSLFWILSKPKHLFMSPSSISSKI